MPSNSSNVRLLSFCLLLLDTVSALSIKRPTRELTYTSLGCYTDNVGGKRALGGRSTTADDMSVAKCATFCSQFELFGVEYGRECFCGNSRDTGSTVVDFSECSYPCAANPIGVEKCGAGNRLNLYSNPNPITKQSATLPGVKSLGCFVDNGARVLPNRYTSANDMTAAKCAQNCGGYTYFGTQWSSECYCGNTVPSVAASASECNMACSGDGDELCGGGMRLNVYKVDSTATVSSSATAQPTGPTAPVAIISGYGYQGCYTDNVPQRVLAGKTSAHQAMTLEKCAAFCKVGGYSWFGVEYNYECYCGTKLDALSTKEPESACNAACYGNTSQKCGGANHLNVYMNPSLTPSTQQSSTSISGFQYRSCWTDRVDDRSLKAVDYRTDDMTAENCADRCKGYSYFGLEYSRECYCGDTLAGSAATETECGMLCMGANNQWCGGPDRMNLWAQATVSTSASVSSSTVSSATSTLVSSTSTSTTATISSTSSLQVSSSMSSSQTILSSSSASSSSVLSSSTTESPTSSSTSSSVFSSSTSQTVVSSSSTSGSVSFTASVSSTPGSSSASSSLSSSIIVTSTPSPQSSSFLPSSTLMTPTTTTSSGPALTTITNCPATPTYNGTPEYCYAPGSLPAECQRLTSDRRLPLMDISVSNCKAALSTRDVSMFTSAVSCFPSSMPAHQYDAVVASAFVSSLMSCFSAPSASLFCQYDSDCSTNTYIVGNIPSPTPTVGIGEDTIKDGGFEDGNFNNWTPFNRNPPDVLALSVDRSRPRTGSYGISMRYMNSNGASVMWSRNLKVVPGKTYQFQVYYYNTNPSGSACSLSLRTDFAAIRYSSLRYGANEWLTKDFTFTAPKSWSLLIVEFRCNTNGGRYAASGKTDVWLDDWTLKRLD